MKKTGTERPGPGRIIAAREIRETPEAYWFRATDSDGRTFLMTVPK